VTVTSFTYAVGVFAGDGDDVLTGGPDGLVGMAGGAGDDTVYSRGSASLAGGPGNDVLIAPAGTRGNMAASPGADATLGEGTFFWDYSSEVTGVTVTPDGIANDGAPGEGDNVSPHTDVLYGGDGDDDLTAGDRETFLLAHGGNDVIHGGPLRDGLFGGPGDDAIYAQGGGNDIIGCSDGSDQAFVDALTELSFNSGCESVVVGP
jgi:Ca2+-binding RTX toxin-like protein